MPGGPANRKGREGDIFIENWVPAVAGMTIERNEMA